MRGGIDICIYNICFREGTSGMREYTSFRVVEDTWGGLYFVIIYVLCKERRECSWWVDFEDGEKRIIEKTVTRVLLRLFLCLW